MNAKFATALVFAAVVAAPAFATNTVDYGNIAFTPGTVTRADVRAEVLRARAAGELDITEASPAFPVAAASGLTRAEVRAEAIRARAAGELDYTEANYPLLAAATPSTLTRAEVRAEFIRARDAREIESTESGTRLVSR